MPDEVYNIIAKAAAEELATEHRGFYSDTKQNVLAVFSLGQIYRLWGPVAHRGWAQLMLDRRCLVEVPSSPRHRADCALAEANYNEQEKTKIARYSFDDIESNLERPEILDESFRRWHKVPPPFRNLFSI